MIVNFGQHQFITRARPTSVIIELIHRTKAAVRDLDNLNYRKMKKILMVESCETESTVGDGEGEDEPLGGGDSSKSNSITSEQSIQSTGISASSQSSSTNSIPLLPRTQEPDNANASIYPLSVRNRTKVSQFLIRRCAVRINQMHWFFADTPHQ